MQHAGKADPGAEMLRVGGDGDQRLGAGLEQDVVDHRLVLVLAPPAGDLGTAHAVDNAVGNV